MVFEDGCVWVCVVEWWGWLCVVVGGCRGSCGICGVFRVFGGVQLIKLKVLRTLCAYILIWSFMYAFAASFYGLVEEKLLKTICWKRNCEKVRGSLKKSSRRFEKVREGLRRFEKVREGSRRIEKVREGSRRFEKVREGSRRFEKVREGSRRFEKV